MSLIQTACSWCGIIIAANATSSRLAGFSAAGVGEADAGVGGIEWPAVGSVPVLPQAAPAIKIITAAVARPIRRAGVLRIMGFIDGSCPVCSRGAAPFRGVPREKTAPDGDRPHSVPMAGA
ncbi:hypothetical protein GCM10028864_03730 [Microlunatus parietis]